MKNKLTDKDIEKLVEFAKFFKTYNPEFRMADAMKTNFIKLREEINPIVDKANGY